MKLKGYIKVNEKLEAESAELVENSLNELSNRVSIKGLNFDYKPRALVVVSLLLLALPIMALMLIKACHHAVPSNNLVEIHLADKYFAQIADKRGIISVPQGIVKANPFLPYRDIGGMESGLDIPSANLVEPPATLNQASDAARVMDTIVSGILYDKYSPSAILNIEGNDYLVKKGDVINNYKVLTILRDSVTVQLGSNVYTAGIGQLLTDGTLNYNEVSNLSKKFGGIR